MPKTPPTYTVEQEADLAVVADMSAAIKAADEARSAALAARTEAADRLQDSGVSWVDIADRAGVMHPVIHRQVNNLRESRSAKAS